MASSSDPSDDTSNVDPDKVDVGASVGFGMSMVIKTIKLKFPKAKTITTSKLSYWLKPSSDTDVILLDCRPKEEYDISHIENSTQVDWQSDDMAELVKNIPNLNQTETGSKQKAVVCYCSVGYRSSAVDQKLQDYLQFRDGSAAPPVYNLEGSLFQWANEGRPMIDSTSKKTVVAHPYSSIWGKLLNKELRKGNL